MENTCIENECFIFKKLKLKSTKECPNHIESWWEEGNTGKKELISDCSPKRTLVMVQDLHNLVISLHKANNEQRNASDTAFHACGALMQKIAHHQLIK